MVTSYFCYPCEGVLSDTAEKAYGDIRDLKSLQKKSTTEQSPKRSGNCSGNSSTAETHANRGGRGILHAALLTQMKTVGTASCKCFGSVRKGRQRFLSSEMQRGFSKVIMKALLKVSP